MSNIISIDTTQAVLPEDLRNGDVVARHFDGYFYRGVFKKDLMCPNTMYLLGDRRFYYSDDTTFYLLERKETPIEKLGNSRLYNGRLHEFSLLRAQLRNLGLEVVEADR